LGRRRAAAATPPPAPPHDVTLRLRLVLGIATVALLLAAPLALAFQALRGAKAAAYELRGQEVAAALLLGRTRDIVQEVPDAEEAVLFVPESPEGPTRMRRATRALGAVADSLRRFGLDSQVLVLRDAAHDLATAAPLQAEAMRTGRKHVADSISDARVAPAVRAAERALNEAERIVRGRADRTASDVRNAVDIALSQAIFLFLAGAAGATAVSVWLTRSVSEPVRDLARGMEAVAGGRFDHALRLTPARRDEFGALAANFATMTRRLAELDRLRAEFMSVASHELKTPLNVVLGYVSLIGEGVYGPVTAEQQGVLRTVEEQTRHLTRLVQRLLDVSRFRAAGAAAIEPRPLALRAYLDDLWRAHRVLADQRRLTFTLAAEDPGLPATVCWDADRMAEVLGNLVSNAVKFTPPGGRVTLTVEPAPDYAAAALGRPGAALRVCVEDSGVGIAPEQLPHVFDKFYQANNQARASAPGTGLGLAIAKQIVEAHGGVIGAESTPDVGTRFVLLLPVDALPSTGEAGPTAAAALKPPGDARPAPSGGAPTTTLPPHTDGLADDDVIALPGARRAEGAAA
jgi:signal transduction histidine kinase